MYFLWNQWFITDLLTCHFASSRNRLDHTKLTFLVDSLQHLPCIKYSQKYYEIWYLTISMHGECIHLEKTGWIHCVIEESPRSYKVGIPRRFIRIFATHKIFTEILWNMVFNNFNALSTHSFWKNRAWDNDEIVKVNGISEKLKCVQDSTYVFETFTRPVEYTVRVNNMIHESSK